MHIDKNNNSLFVMENLYNAHLFYNIILLIIIHLHTFINLHIINGCTSKLNLKVILKKYFFYIL